MPEVRARINVSLTIRAPATSTKQPRGAAGVGAAAPSAPGTLGATSILVRLPDNVITTELKLVSGQPSGLTPEDPELLAYDTLENAIKVCIAPSYFPHLLFVPSFALVVRAWREGFSPATTVARQTYNLMDAWPMPLLSPLLLPLLRSCPRARTRQPRASRSGCWTSAGTPSFCRQRASVRPCLVFSWRAAV